MIRKLTDLRQSEPERAIRINRIIDEVIRQRAKGHAVNEAAVEREHTDLLPELHDKLLILKKIEVAAEHARQRSSEFDAQEVAFKEEQDHLEACLDGYRILQRIEYGGQGAIYRAVQLSTKRLVAIKVLLHGPLASEHQRQRFEREVDLVSRLRHPNIVTLYESGEVRGRPYFAMEFIDGVSIGDYLILEQPTVQACVRLISKVCRAVAHAHQRGIIHRDLKPENILVDEAGEPHVLDFGLAKLLADDETDADHVSVSMAGCVVGTMPYLSPERVGTSKADADVRSDIYSLGVVLYKLLTGQFPYPVDGDLVEVYTNITTQEPMSPRRAIDAGDAEDRLVTGAINDDLERVILKSLAKDPARRYQSADAFADDLDRYLAGEAVEAKSDSSIYVLKKTIRRFRLQVFFSGAILVLLLAASALVTHQWFQTRAQRENARKAVAVGQATLDDVITLVLESVGSLAGASEVQTEILQVVQDRFHELIPLMESDEAMAATRGRIQERLGDMAEKEGRHADATEHYMASLAIESDLDLKQGRSREHDLTMLRVHRKLGGVAKDRQAWFERAIQHGRALFDTDPDSNEIRYELCEAYVEYTRYLFHAGRFADAAERIGMAVSMAERAMEEIPDDIHWIRLLASACEWDGENRLKLGDGNRGIALLEKSLHLRESLLPTSSADVTLRGEILDSSIKLGTSYRENGQVDRAKALFEKSIEMGEYLTKVDPRVAIWKRRLLSVHDRLTRIYIEINDFENAEKHCVAMVEFAKQLIAIEPKNVDWRVLLGYAYSDRGKLFYAQQNWKSAHEEFLNALEIRERILAVDKSRLAAHVNLAETKDLLARCCVRLDRMAEAFGHYDQARNIRRQLMDDQPGVLKYALSHVYSLINLSSWHLWQKTPEDDRSASALLAEAESRLQALNESGSLAALQGKHSTLRKGIENNQRIIEKRAANRQTSTMDGAGDL